MSSRAPEIQPLRIKVRASGLKTVGYAVAPGIRQLKKSRIVDTAGSLKEADLETLDEAIRAYLSDHGCALRFTGIAPSESLGCNKDGVALRLTQAVIRMRQEPSYNKDVDVLKINVPVAARDSVAAGRFHSALDRRGIEVIYGLTSQRSWRASSVHPGHPFRSCQVRTCRGKSRLLRGALTQVFNNSQVQGQR